MFKSTVKPEVTILIDKLPSLLQMKAGKIEWAFGF